MALKSGAWHQCSRCGETYHYLNGHYVPARGISLCEFCVAAQGGEEQGDG